MSKIFDPAYFYIIYVPVVFSVVLAAVRRARFKYWIIVSCMASLATIAMLLWSSGQQQWWTGANLSHRLLGLLMSGILPSGLMCLTPRLRWFHLLCEEWPVAIILIGPISYWLGYVVGLSIWVAVFGFNP